MREYSDICGAESKSEAFEYTLNFDLDGNGHSGRLYRLFHSRSLLLKQIVFLGMARRAITEMASRCAHISEDGGLSGSGTLLK